MAKTYTLSGTLHGGRRSGFTATMANCYAMPTAQVGGDGTYTYATNALFDSSILSALQSKTVTSIKLTLTVTGTLYQDRGGDPYYDTYLIAYKLNDIDSTDSSGSAWTTSDNGSEASVSRIAQITSGTSSTVSGTNTVTYDLTGSEVPNYGYVFRPAAMLNSRITITAATLAVETNETDYTLGLSYLPNGGSGAPAAQSATVTTTGTPSYTFTIPQETPTRSGYGFLGWSRSETATTASYQPGGTITVTENTVLYAVWRASASTISAQNGTIGSALTIAITRQNSAYRDTISYSFGETSGIIVTKTNASSVSWTPAMTLCAQIPNAASGNCILTVATFDGNDNQLGTNSITIALSVPSTVKVMVSSVALSDTVSSVATQFGTFVQTKSKLAVNVSTDSTTAYGATVSAYNIAINSQTLTANNAVTDVLLASGTQSYTVTITDSRGKTDTYTGTYSVAAYQNPSVSFTAERDASVHTDINISYSYAIAPVNNRNVPRLLTIYAKEHDEEYYGSPIDTITLQSASGSGQYAIEDCTATIAFDVRLVVSDYFTSQTYDASVAAFGARFFHGSGVDGTVVIGGYNTSDGDHHFKGHDLRIDTGVLKLGEGTAKWTGTDAAEYAVTRARSASSATSFAHAVSYIQNEIGDSALSYGATVADRIRTNISSYPSGIYDVSSGGPRFCALVGKYTDSFWTAHLWSYQYQWRMFIRYLNGACAVELTDYPYTRQ